MEILYYKNFIQKSPLKLQRPNYFYLRNSLIFSSQIVYPLYVELNVSVSSLIYYSQSPSGSFLLNA